MVVKEKAVSFGASKTLVGVVAEPEGTAQKPAVLLLNAGLIHHIGPNRVYVKLARRLAEEGHRVLRFDYSGVGDSQPRPDHMPVEQFTIDDVVQAMNFLSGTFGDQQFVLMGHCAGAYNSFRTAAEDPRVSGAVMMNPDGGEADWADYDRKRKLARYYQNYYGRQALFDPQRWKRFFTGRISYLNVAKTFFQNVVWSRVSQLIFRLRQRFVKQPPTQADEKLFTVEAILRKLFDLDLRVLLIYSEGATSLERAQNKMGKAIKQLGAAGKLQVTVIPDADHIFTPLATQDALFERIVGWCESF